MRTPEHPTPEQANQPQDRTEICRACGSVVLGELRAGARENSSRRLGGSEAMAKDRSQQPIRSNRDRVIDPPSLPVLARVVVKKTVAGDVLLGPGGPLQVDANRFYRPKTKQS